MPARLVTNSFSSGVLSPELHGRRDLRQYYQAAASIENFLVRATGGIRKRPGTSLVARVAAEGAEAFRVIPVFRDRDKWSALVLYRKVGSNTLYYRTLSEDGEPSEERTASAAAQVESAAALASVRYRQIGDTLFFTRRGRRAVTAKVFYDEAVPRVEWSAIPDAIQVAKPSISSIAVKWPPEGRDKSKGYMPSTRTYGLIGVKYGIYSQPDTRTADIWLPWVGGATVTVKFVPDFSAHDYYVLAQMQGADWCAMSYFYRNTEMGSPTDCSSWSGDSMGEAEINGGEYAAGGMAVGEALLDADPNRTEETALDGGGTAQYHPTATILASGTALTATYKNASAPILAVKVWWGALLRTAGATPDGVDAVGTPGTATVTLSSGGAAIQTWRVSSLYAERETTLSVDSPVAGAGASYTLGFVSADGETPVVLRGIALCSDVGERVFTDNYIGPGSTVGSQERLTVGDGGMDCGLADVWEQRLVMASSPTLPFTLWFSRTGDIYNFYADRPQTQACAFSASIPAIRASRILHMMAAQWFLLFTESGEYRVDSAGNSGFGYATITIRRTSNVGADERVEPVQTERHVLFVAHDGRSVYELEYSLEQDNVIPRCRSTLASILSEGRRIVRVAYQQHPDPVLWCLLDDGTLLAMTYSPDDGVFAWSRHTMQESGLKVVDILAPGTSTSAEGGDAHSDILLVLESDDDPGVCWIEAMRRHPAGDSPPEADAECVDHAGYAEADWPSAGDPAREVLAAVETLRPESPEDSPIALDKNIFDCALRLNRSGAVRIRPAGTELPWSQTTQDAPVVADGRVGLVTRDVRVLPAAYNNRDGRMRIESADRWPCEILSLLHRIEVAADPQEERR